MKRKKNSQRGFNDLKDYKYRTSPNKNQEYEREIRKKIQINILTIRIDAKRIRRARVFKIEILETYIRR